MTIVKKDEGNHTSFVVRFMRAGRFLYYGYHRTYQEAYKMNEAAKIMVDADALNI